MAMDSVAMHICELLRKETDWITFDELYRRMPKPYDWVDIAVRLERLVKAGIVQYWLPPGRDVGQYRIK